MVRIQSKVLSVLLCIILIFTSLLTVSAAAQPVRSDTGAKTADLVIFAHFTDDTQESADAYFAEKYPDFKNYFIGDYGRSFVNYLKTISYGKHTVNVVFPQETSDGTISSIPLPMSQEEAKNANVDAQVIDAVIKSMPSLADLAVDMDHDGYIDNLTIICKAESCSEVEQGATLVSHSSNSGTAGTVNGYKICNYNMLNTDRLEVTKSGLLLHEYLHTLGFPDLYRTDGTKDYPVYIWDIMASVSDSPSYPLTYLRAKIGGWMSLGEISESGTYTLSAQDSASGTKGFVIKSPLRDTEFFVVEYRKRPANIYSNDSLDRMVQGSGIIVYRVDTTVQDYSNAKGYTGIWVFRPVNGMPGYNPSNDLVNIINANLSEESGRTAIGSADMNDGLTQGALTFTNGENSGIVISQVGSAADDTISFSVMFPDLSDTDLWTNTGFTSSGSDPFKGITIEEIDGNVIAVEYDGNGFTAYRQSEDSWTKASAKLSCTNYADSMKLFSYEGSTFLMYTDYVSGLVVKKLDLTSGSWSNVTSISTDGYYFDAAQVGNKIYVSYLKGDYGNSASLAVFNGTAISDIGTYHTSSFADGDQHIVELDEIPYVFVRDASGNVLNGFKYEKGKFSKITDGSIKANAFDAAVHNGVIYIASVDPTTSCLQLSTYNGTAWTTNKTEIDSAEAALTMINDNIYVLASPSSGDGNFKMYAFSNSEIRQEGDTAIDAAASGFTAISVGNTIYLSYVRMADKISLIKSKVAYGTGSGGEVIIPSTKKNLSDAIVTNDENGIRVEYRGTVLKEGQDYSVTALDSTAIITGMGENYEGTVTRTFENYCEKSSKAFAAHTEIIDPAVSTGCTTPGKSEGSHCAVCNMVLIAQQMLPATGHSYNVVVTEPTCTTKGYTTHTCKNCGDSYNDAEAEALGHNYTSKITKVSTCTEAGEKTYTCGRCSDTYTESIKATGHCYNEVVTGPTCTTKGYTTHTCKNCSNSYTDSETAALGHNYTSRITNASTCTEAGEKTYTCGRCSDTYTESIKATGHNYSAVVSVPTCTEKGYTTHACKNCSNSYTDSETAALGHNYTSRITKASTCTEAGEKTYTCGRCSDTYTESIKATGHKFSTYIFNNDAMIGVDGTETAVCDNGCGRTDSRISEGTALSEPETMKFTDVKVGAYYEEAVNWAVSNKITSGTTPSTFEPDRVCTRGQVVMFLWNAAGRPEPKTGANPFTDVNADAYYYKAVLWAVENKITSGTSMTRFEPGLACTRSQVVAFQHRKAGSPKPKSSANPFTDVKSGAWYFHAVLWAVENKITSGTSETLFSPEMPCTRGQIVTFLYREMVTETA